MTRQSYEQNIIFLVLYFLSLCILFSLFLLYHIVIYFFCEHFCSHVLQRASRRVVPHHPRHKFYRVHMQAATAREAQLSYRPNEWAANRIVATSLSHASKLYFTGRCCWMWNTFTPTFVFNVPNTFTFDWSLRRIVVPLCELKHKLCSLFDVACL